MRNFNIVLVILFSLFLASCAHTNDLAKFEVKNSKILFKQIVSAQARTVKIEKFSEVKSENDNKNDLSSLLKAVVEVSNDILAADKQEKLQKLISTDALLSAISENLVESMSTYLEIVPVNNLSHNPDFISTVKLKSCKLLINKDKLAIYVEASANLIERATSKIVWENSESRQIPIQKNYGTELNAGDLTDVVSALQLATLDEKQINLIIDEAADDVGSYMAETLREDIVQSNKDRMKLNSK